MKEVHCIVSYYLPTHFKALNSPDRETIVQFRASDEFKLPDCWYKNAHK